MEMSVLHELPALSVKPYKFLHKLTRINDTTMCKQAPSPFCNRTGLFLLHFHENTATLLPQLLQITVMLRPHCPVKNASTLILYSRNTGFDKSQAQSSQVEISCVTYYFWEKLFIVLHVS
jgi:hypothetical protein